MRKGGWRPKAQDCLIAALGGYVGARRAIPRAVPGAWTNHGPAAGSDRHQILLYGAMRAQGVGNTALAVRLGLSEGVVRRLIDFDHHSHIYQIDSALHALGQWLKVSTRTA